MILDHGNLGIWKQDAATSPLGSKILVGTSLRTGLILQCGDFDNSALGENMFSGWSPTPTGAWLISDAIVAWWVLNNFDHEEVADLAPRDFRWASAIWFQWCLAFAKGGEPKGQGENHVLERRGVSCSQRRVFVSRKTWTKGSCKWWNVVFFWVEGKVFRFLDNVCKGPANIGTGDQNGDGWNGFGSAFPTPQNPFLKYRGEERNIQQSPHFCTSGR